MWSVIEALQVALPGLLLVAVVWYGSRLTLEGRIAVGELVMAYGAISFLLLPLQLFGEFAMSFSFSRPSAARAARVLSLRRPGEDRHGGETAVASNGHHTGPPVDVRTDVQQGPREGLYDPVTGLHAPTGLLTAVVCGDPDAAGQLAERLGGHSASAQPDSVSALPDSVSAQPACAPVLLDGVPLDGMTLEKARTAVLVQDKDPVLLSGTLADLLDVPSSGKVSAEQALATAQCDDVLAALVQGSPDADRDPMRARISERGRSLSGGQRQRLALARSLITDPEVLVLDEPTSAVDSHTEARIARELAGLRSGRTTVVFSSSPLLLDRADQVVFVRGTHATAHGTHRELLRSEAEYRAVVTRAPQTDAAGAAESRTISIQPEEVESA
jgi:ABC-type multidrug transport system fused ATPase/permease subunit